MEPGNRDPLQSKASGLRLLLPIHVLKKSNLAALACLVAFPGPCPAESALPAVGAFGFDWLRPGSARCEAITGSARKRFRQCDYQTSGTFGLSDPVRVCRISERSEYLIYASQAACVRNLETMKAHAP